MKRRASSISTVLQNILKQYELEQQYNINYVIQFWTEIVPTNISKICHPIEIANGTLNLKANTEAWRKEILDNKDTLIKMINEKTEKAVIKDIKVI